MNSSTIGPRQMTGFLFLDDEVHTHRFHTVALPWHHPVVERRRGFVVREAEHRRGVRAVDIRVQQPDVGPRRGQRHREIRRDRALADTALPATDRDDVLYLRDDLDARARIRCARFEPTVDRRNAVDIECRSSDLRSHSRSNVECGDRQRDLHRRSFTRDTDLTDAPRFREADEGHVATDRCRCERPSNAGSEVVFDTGVVVRCHWNSTVALSRPRPP